MSGNPFGNMPGGMGGMMKAMQQAMKSTQKIEDALAEERIESTSGGGMVKVTVTGKAELVEIKISPEVVDPTDVQMLEDLVSTAVRDAMEKANSLRAERLSGLLPGGMNMPGLF